MQNSTWFEKIQPSTWVKDLTYNDMLPYYYIILGLLMLKNFLMLGFLLISYGFGSIYSVYQITKNPLHFVMLGLILVIVLYSWAKQIGLGRGVSTSNLRRFEYQQMQMMPESEVLSRVNKPLVYYPQVHTLNPEKGMMVEVPMMQSQALIFLDILQTARAATKMGQTLTVLDEPPVLGFMSYEEGIKQLKARQNYVDTYKNIPIIHNILGLVPLQRSNVLGAVITNKNDMQLLRQFASGAITYAQLSSKSKPTANAALQMGSYGAGIVLKRYAEGGLLNVEAEQAILSEKSQIELSKSSIDQNARLFKLITGKPYETSGFSGYLNTSMIYNVSLSLENFYSSASGELTSEGIEYLNSIRKQYELGNLSPAEIAEANDLVTNTNNLSAREMIALEKVALVLAKRRGPVALLYGGVHNFMRHQQNYKKMKIEEYQPALQNSMQALWELQKDTDAAKGLDAQTFFTKRRRILKPKYRKWG